MPFLTGKRFRDESITSDEQDRRQKENHLGLFERLGRQKQVVKRVRKTQLSRSN